MAKKEIKYSDALQEIEEIIQLIENEELDLDDLSEKVKRVTSLIKLCKKKLHETENDIQKVLDEMDE
jgi:exodeoxyribonuclease VII small subunit